MNFLSHFKQVALRTLFVVGLLVVMSLPQLQSEYPPPPFSSIRTITRAMSLGTWLVVVLAVGLAMLLFSWLRTLSFGSKVRETHPIQSMPLQQAVLPERGGNGLVSDAFPLKLPWLGFCGWVEVETPGMEGLIVDGRHVIRETSFHISPVRLLGKPVSARRVLLAPEPHVIPTVEALSSDKWQTKIDGAITFRVDDPLSVLSKRPLDDLKNLAVGVVAEHIRTHPAEDLLGDTGALRRTLEQRLRESPVLQGLSIVEVPLSITGDERLIETRRLEAIERSMQDLVRLSGQNQLTKAGFDNRIQELAASLEEWQRDQEQRRQMQQLGLSVQADTVQSFVAAIAQIASAGINPATAVEQIRSLVKDLGEAPGETVSAPSTQQQLPSVSRIEEERRLLSEKKYALGVSEMTIESSPDTPDLPGNARLLFDGYALLVTCSSDYPAAPPKVEVEPDGGQPKMVVIPWQSDSFLVHAVTAAVMQIRAQTAEMAEEEA